MSNINRPRRGLLDGLADIVGDLYGENAAANARLAQELQADSPVPAATSAPADVPAPAAAPAPAPVYAARPTLPPFRDLWKVADEPIDWTEMMSNPNACPDPDKRAIYAAAAPRVLAGDTEAYLTVLRAANPMADLMPYVASLDVATMNADHLQATFAARADLMEENARNYLCGMALRIARDLFAVLPVTQVTVTALHQDAQALSVRFEKQELRKVRFAFIDPVAFVTACGGECTC